VLHFGRFDSPYFGGLERHVRLLLGHLPPDIRADNLVAQDAIRSPDVEMRDGYRVFRAPSWGLIASVPMAPRLVSMARALWRDEEYSIAHLHFPDPLSHAAALALPADASIVITWHSDVIRQRRFMALYQPWLNRLLNRARAIVAATPCHFDSSTQLRVDRGKVRVIPYGLDYRDLDKTAAVAARAEELRRRHGTRTLVFALGRHVYYKGFEYLIRAAQRLDASIVIGGSGPLLDQHRALVRLLGVDDRVHLPGRIADADLAAHYHACDIFCLPSVASSEAFGLVQLEAMACEKPVICCALGNGVNFVNPHLESGITVPPRDPAALADAIQRLAGDPELRRRLGAAGRRRAREEYSLERMVSGHANLYREIAGRSAGAQGSTNPVSATAMP
jgi:rhamnosyl/mannosyltransferase